MKKQAENQPIDDLFARKLGNMSLPPSPDGFERLQARMGQSKLETRVVFWRNPIIQRYMAAAACLLLICLFGWLYWPSASISTMKGPQVATNQLARPQKSIHKQNLQQPVAKAASEEIPPNQPIHEPTASQFAEISKPIATGQVNSHLPTSPVQPGLGKNTIKPLPALANEQPVLAQTQPADNNIKPGAPTAIVVPTTGSSTPERLAENIVKPSPPAERVLVVTIAEPEALVAARQTKGTVDEKPVVALQENPEKETKVGGLWKQVKRLKEGELFARHDNPSNDDRGLLGRAYSGLKQSFDKDKSIKQ